MPNRGNNLVAIERLQAYTPEDATGIGRLMPFLSERLDDSPIDEDLLQTIIASPHHDQLVARAESRIVGAATLSTIMGTADGKQGWLNDFVTDPGMRGVGTIIWDEIGRWCADHDITILNFTSHQKRLDAHRFYENRGAEVRDITRVYRKDFRSDHH